MPQLQKRIKIRFYFLSFILGITFASFILPLKNIWQLPFFSNTKAFLSNKPDNLSFLYFIFGIFILLLYNFNKLNTKTLKLLKTQQSRQNIIKFINLGICVTLFLIGNFKFNSSILSPDNPQNINFYNDSRIEAKVVIEQIVKKPDKMQLVTQPIQINNQDLPKKINGKIQIYTKHSSPLTLGDVLLIKGGLLEIENFTTEFSYQDYLYKDDIYSQSIYPELTKIDQKQSLKFKSLRPLYNTKQEFKKIIEQNIPNHNSAQFINSIILGDKTKLDESIKTNFQKTGLSHVIAVSGLHIGIIGGIIYFLLLKLFSIHRTTSIIIAAIFMFIFILLIGASNPPSSALRATIMGTLVLIAFLTGRIYNFKNGLLLAACIILFINPKYLKYDLGFQLSFLSLLGIFYFYPLLEDFYKKIKLKLLIPKFERLKTIFKERYQHINLSKLNIKTPKSLALIFLSISAQAGTLTLTIFRFKLISFIAPIANLIVVPLLPILLSTSLLLIFTSFISPSIASFLGEILSIMVEFILRITEILANTPGAYWEF